MIVLLVFKEIEGNRGEEKFTYFEFATLAALNVFKKHNLDLVVLEVGLGGRLDAINIVNNNISIITSISLDHCEYLGDTIEKIAYEKAGVIKDHNLVIVGDSNGLETIKDIAIKKQAKLQFIGE